MSQDDAVETGDYRELSTAAVVALVLGIASPLACLGGVLLVVPLVALAVGVAALRTIDADPAGRSGRNLAISGAALAAGCLAMVVVQPLLTGWLLMRQAQPTSDAWLAAVQARDLDTAMKLTAPPPRRLPDPDSDSEAPPPTLDKRFPAVGDLITLQGWSGSQMVSRAAHGRPVGGGWLVVLVYRLEQRAADEPLEMRISLSRKPSVTGQLSKWWVTNVDPPTPVSDR